MSRPKVVAILETMWDWRSQTSGAGYSQAPPAFRINRKNYSGKRLYKLVGDEANLLVTNACRELVSSPKHHGKGDPDWLMKNLKRLDGENGDINVLLICGKVAQATYARFGFTPQRAREIWIPHPAARAYWTKQVIEETAGKIQELIGESHASV